ncbi:Bug family tripartite tricarboxylate transporter substrate binding protein [Xylophilus sp. GOD-11R]|uniref:Bug family tripartite tricarboxylate transporter substrate binding protein n=1 Tax=Xylophilus sp. GOD-11R TaxID=3089814 RepID=UPI00298D3352|nr:tripartite tricarboxylate transporter substrate-binding protein [Xylophilus sp. GOD-11R]WPB55908.1 tripartite tricarboxylate transporter substrate-binding protein [Xylophilus sp. GOD-11R]
MNVDLSRRRIAHVAFAVVAGLGLGSTATSAADAFPSKPIRIIVPAAPGGSMDLITRLIAQKMGERLGQPVLVDNRVGGDTMVGTRYVKDQPADGYTILAQANGFTIIPALKSEAGYDPVKDFNSIGLMSRLPFMMLVGATDPSRNLAEFIARARTDKLTFASGGIGGPPHMAAAMFFRQQGLDVATVPYKGNGVALPDVASGLVNTIFDGYISSISYIQSGKLRPLAVTSTARIAPLPNVPTFAEQGVNYSYTLWLGLVAKAGTPKDVVQKLSDALRYAITSKELHDRFVSEGSDPTPMSPQELDDYVVKETAEMKKLVAELGIPKQ